MITMARKYKVVSGLIVWAILTAGFSAYNYFLRAPSVVAARPELADLGFTTALFSGQFNAWLWFNHPVGGLVFTSVTALFWVVVAWTMFIR